MRASIVMMVLMFCFVSLFAEETNKNDRIAEAVTAMETWLAVIDSGGYAESWKSTGKIFKAQVADSQ